MSGHPTAVAAAAEAGDLARLQAMLEARSEGRGMAVDSAANTALHWASAVGNVELVQEILSSTEGVADGEESAGRPLPTFQARDREREADASHSDGVTSVINAQNLLGDTPLHRAAWGGHGQVCSVLLAYSADPNAVNKAGKRAADRARGLAFEVLAEWREGEEEEEDTGPTFVLNLSDTEYDEEGEEESDESDDGWTVQEILGKQRLESLFLPPSR